MLWVLKNHILKGLENLKLYNADLMTPAASSRRHEELWPPEIALRPPEIDSPMAFPPLPLLVENHGIEFSDGEPTEVLESHGKDRKWYINEDGDEEYEVSESGSETSFYGSIPSPPPCGFELQDSVVVGEVSPVAAAFELQVRDEKGEASPTIAAAVQSPPAADYAHKISTAAVVRPSPVMEEGAGGIPSPTDGPASSFGGEHETGGERGVGFSFPAAAAASVPSSPAIAPAMATAPAMAAAPKLAAKIHMGGGCDCEAFGNPKTPKNPNPNSDFPPIPRFHLDSSPPPPPLH